MNEHEHILNRLLDRMPAKNQKPVKALEVAGQLVKKKDHDWRVGETVLAASVRRVREDVAYYRGQCDGRKRGGLGPCCFSMTGADYQWTARCRAHRSVTRVAPGTVHESCRRACPPRIHSLYLVGPEGHTRGSMASTCLMAECVR